MPNARSKSIYSAAVIEGEQIFLRYPEFSDLEEFVELNSTSLDFHQGLVNPPKDEKSFREFLAKNENPENESLFACIKNSGAIAGALSLSQIVRGGFQNAYLGYYVGKSCAGKGFGTEAISLIVKFAFEKLNLHRIEANIQPGNLASIAVVRKNGFVREGFSKEYLKIDGKWRDHERWAIVNQNWKEE